MLDVGPGLRRPSSRSTPAVVLRDGVGRQAPPRRSDDLDIDGSLLDTIEQELADVEQALALSTTAPTGSARPAEERSTTPCWTGRPRAGSAPSTCPSSLR